MSWVDSRIFGILLVTALLIGCTGTTGQTVLEVPEETVKIGSIFMLSGLAASWGANSQMGAELAVEEINEQGGINGKKLEIVHEDNQGDNPKVAISALRKLNNQGIKIVLGPNWSPSGLATAPIACNEKTIMISPSLGLAGFNEECDYIFNVWPHDEESSEKLAEYTYKEGYRKIAILGSLQVWEQQQAEAVKRKFEELGGKVVVFELPQGNEREFRSEAAKIAASGAEAVVFTNQAYIHLSAKRLRELGVKKPFFSVLVDSDQIAASDGALEGTVAVTSLTPSDEFRKKFVEEYGKNPDMGADTSYDAVMLIAEAMRETGSDNPEVLKEYLNSLESYDGASGSLIFDGKGGVKKQPHFMVVKNGELVRLD